MKRPNILYIHSHDTGRRIEPYGYPVATPNLQILADQGVLFRQAYCVSPTCSPSRAGLLTGQYPHQCGQWGLANMGYPLAHPERHVVKVLQPHGYYTALLGVQHVTADERDIGYDEVREEIIGGAAGIRDPEMCASQVGPAAEAWLAAHAKDDAPWFLDVGMIQTHTSAWRRIPQEKMPGTREIDRARPSPGLPDTFETRQWHANHQVSASQLDEAIGGILAALESLGLAENTLVIYTTDHGVGLVDHKCSLNDGGLEVSLIIRGPGWIGGRTVHAMVTHLDVIPTLCDICDIEAPDWLEGRSLLPLVTGESTKLHDSIFSEINVHGFSLPERSVRTERYRLIRRWWQEPDQPWKNIDPSPANIRMHEYGWPERVTKPESDVLHDLFLDPLGRRDRSLDPEYREIYADMVQQLTGWMEKTGDSLLQQGLVAIPKPLPFQRPAEELRKR